MTFVLILRATCAQDDVGSGLTFTLRQKRKKGKKVKRKKYLFQRGYVDALSKDFFRDRIKQNTAVSFLLEKM